MIVLERDDHRRHRQTSKIDLVLTQLERSGPGQQIVPEQAADPVEQEGARDMGAVREPMEDVGRRRFPVEQVMADYRRPDQVVGAHYAEKGLQLMRRHYALRL